MNFLRLATFYGLTFAGFVSADEKADFFEAKVRPILATHCFECHGSKDKGGLKLDSHAAVLKGGESGVVIVPGKPEKSLLLKAVRHVDEDLSMPPKKKLPSHVIADLTRWIREGAVWGEAKAIGFATGKITTEQRKHWAFQPVKNVKVGKGHPVDELIQTALAKQKLEQVKLADKGTLIRRATFDLTGLPPTPAEVQAFLADHKPGAWGRVVEQLLASPRYGERWGRHWLDLVRYADTAGDAGDYPIPEAYKHRNYVIDAFNNDKPYDQFVREQIAGDQLSAANDEERWEQTIGTGYIAISRRIGVSPHNLKHITIEDTLNNLGKTFLGLTIGCARCHDHKFDPIPTADYYALYGIFSSSIYPHVGAEHSPHRHSFVYRMGKAKSDAMLKPFRDKLTPWDKKERDKFAVYQSFQKKVITANITRQSVWAELEQIRSQRGDVAKTFPNLDIAFAIVDGEPTDVHIQKQGDPKAKGAKVRRGFFANSGRAETARGRQRQRPPAIGPVAD